MSEAPAPKVAVVMGVSGAGKSTLGAALAQRLGWAFQEGDDFHPPANVAKMAAGVPLTDADRAPWLAAIKAWIDGRLASGQGGVITCSALKRVYRDRVVAGHAGVRLVYLTGSHDLIAGRVAARRGHFMPPALLGSQFAALEAPDADEGAIIVDAATSTAGQVDQVVKALGV
jgi:carbohydrate kinase (thermoresistant glucokinase family)